MWARRIVNKIIWFYCENQTGLMCFKLVPRLTPVRGDSVSLPVPFPPLVLQIGTSECAIPPIVTALTFRSSRVISMKMWRMDFGALF